MEKERTFKFGKKKKEKEPTLTEAILHNRKQIELPNDFLI